jgi:hypothetical protein
MWDSKPFLQAESRKMAHEKEPKQPESVKLNSPPPPPPAAVDPKLNAEVRLLRESVDADRIKKK